MIHAATIQLAIARIATLKFFPAGDEATKVLVGELLGEMCTTNEQVEWLTRRFIRLYSGYGWVNGLEELRATYCSRYRPADGIERDSDVYPDGIPAELPGTPLRYEVIKAGSNEGVRLLAGADPLALPAPAAEPLPPGHTASADVELEQEVANLAARHETRSRKIGLTRPQRGTQEYELFVKPVQEFYDKDGFPK